MTKYLSGHRHSLIWLLAVIVAIVLFSLWLVTTTAGKSDKVLVCHIPAGDQDNAHTINISSSALSAHLEHGDYEGECDVVPDPDPEPQCEVGMLWQIGDIETEQTDNPVDELNWPGEFGNFPSFTNPFTIGSTHDSEFPWNSNYGQAYATDLDLKFEYLPDEMAQVELVLAWSPGKSAVETKEVWLDGVLLDTMTHTGTPEVGWWQYMPVYLDAVPFDLEKGEHTITLKHTSGDGTLWDYVRLDVLDCANGD